MCVWGVGGCPPWTILAAPDLDYFMILPRVRTHLIVQKRILDLRLHIFYDFSFNSWLTISTYLLFSLILVSGILSILAGFKLFPSCTQQLPLINLNKEQLTTSQGVLKVCLKALSYLDLGYFITISDNIASSNSFKVYSMCVKCICLLRDDIFSLPFTLFYPL